MSSSSMLPPDEECGNEDYIRICEYVAVFRIQRPIRTEMHRSIQNRTDADRCTSFNSAIRIDNCADSCVGGPDHISPIFDRAHHTHAQMLVWRGRLAEPSIIGD